MRTFYVDARVFTGTLSLQEAFVVEDGRFLLVGSKEAVMAHYRDGDALISLQGKFVCPGFIDSHMHLLNYGNSLEQCDLSGHTGSIAQIQEALRFFLHQTGLSEGSWLRGRGWNQDYFSPATGIPTREDLDVVSTEHPVCIVRCCGHCLVVNTRALELLGLDSSLPQPEGGSYDVDENGQMTGVFRDTAMSYVYTRLPAPTQEDLKRMLRHAAKRLNACGITSCHSDDLCCFENLSWEDVLDAYEALEKAGELTVRVYEQSQFTTPAALQQFLDKGFCTGTGSDLFRIGPLKMLGDGSLGARTAYLSSGYADAPEEQGIAIFTQKELEDMITLAHGQGMQIAIHAIGDGILDRILNAYEKAFAAHKRGNHRSGIVHVQLTRPEQLKRMQQLGLCAYVQTVFLDYDSRIVYDRAGKALADSSYAFSSMQKMGIPVSNGTDCPVEAPDPMRGIQCAITRQPLDGSLPPYRPDEAMTLEEALISYTVQGAYASFEEHTKGRIAPGMLADFVILSDNPFEAAPEKLSAIHAQATFLGGQCVYREN